MTPHKQLIRHDPANGQWGDCYRTCIASALDLNPEDVPHFMDGGPSPKERDRRIDEWLAPRGLREFNISMPGEDRAAVDEYMRQINPGVLYFFTGVGAGGCPHTVLCRDGEVVHDPSVRGGGIVAPIEELYWIMLLVPRL